MRKRLPFIWDYDIDEEQFLSMLAGNLTLGRLDRDWAAVRLIEYAQYSEIVSFLGFKGLIEGWPLWRQRVRSQSRRRGIDFLAVWIPERHPELVA